MDRQLSQGYLESSSRKRPSPALVSDDSRDAADGLGYRSEGNKFPKLAHDGSHNVPFDFQQERHYGVNSGSRSLSDRDESKWLSPNPVLGTNNDDYGYSSDAMIDVLQEKPEPACCFGMVREMPT